MSIIPNQSSDTDHIMRRKVTIALFVATFLAAIEGTIVGTAMPVITSSLKGVHLLSWVISIYLLASVITTPIYGKLADLFGRKNTFLIGASIFLAGSILSGLSQTMLQLIIFRAIQGLGAGALTTIPHTIIGDLYSYKQRAKVQGWLSSIWGVAGISGPLVGGLLVDYVSWRAIFYMNIPFGIAAIYLLKTSLKEKRNNNKPYIDYPGITVFSAAMIIFIYIISLLDTTGGQAATTNYGLIVGLVIGAAILFLWFIRIELKSPEPMIPLKLFKNRTISTSNIYSFLFCIVTVALTFYLPLWVQGVYGKSATFSGMMMIPLSIAWPLGSIVAGNWITKVGMKKINQAAAIILIIGTSGILWINDQYALMWLAILSGLCGFGFGLTSTSLTVAVTSAVGSQMRGTAVASNNFVRTLGQTIGITLFGLMLHTGSTNKIDPQLLETSLHHIFTIVAVVAVVLLIVGFFMPKPELEKQTD
ncbi:MDR family MFS transporter [Paenibacillus yanchengensis]|uniref:MDR family MFS transporter n=1 Tax=Paenibacillus yanchengensis TaxID=2035833 RepID=A0ABW4YME9_9BACL